MALLNIIQALNLALMQEFARNDKLLIFGEDNLMSSRRIDSFWELAILTMVQNFNKAVSIS